MIQFGFKSDEVDIFEYVEDLLLIHKHFSYFPYQAAGDILNRINLIIDCFYFYKIDNAIGFFSLYRQLRSDIIEWIKRHPNHKIIYVELSNNE